MTGFPTSELLFSDLDAPLAPFELENRLNSKGYQLVAGVDEAGRGPLAGPVVAAAVILDNRFAYQGVRDSKKLTSLGREKAYWLIMRQAKAIGFGLASHDEVERYNILNATFQAMSRAVTDLDVRPDFLLVDGTFPIPGHIPQKAVKRGDAKSLSIGAASIVAKVTRDRIMTAYHQQYPQYDFASHKGYGTKKHFQALKIHGPCPIHRRSFKGVCDPA